MRGLLKAALVLAPALASSAAVRVPDHSREIDVERVDGRSFALINLDAKGSRSPDDRSGEALSFRLDVLPSVEACGSGNVTVDGQVLPQTEEDGLWTGHGSISMDRKSIVVASWSFQCVKPTGSKEAPEVQLMTFKVDFVDGKPLEDATFTAVFQQAGTPEIISIETSLSTDNAEHSDFHHGPSPDDNDGAFPPGPPPHHHGHDEHRPHAEHHEHEHGHKGFHSFEDDMAELHWMRSQLLELEWMIFEKEQAMAHYASESQDEDIRKCDSLKCVIRTAVEKARGAVHHAVGKIVGDDEFDEGFHKHDFPHPPPSRGRHSRPKSGKGKESFKKHGNETHGHPHGNETHPHRPHFHKRPLPVCRFPPPPPHGFGPPPHPHHGPHPGPPPFDFHHGPHSHEGRPFSHAEHAEGPHGPHSPPELSPDERRPFGKFGRPHHDERPHHGHEGGPQFHGDEQERPGHMEEGHRHPGPKHEGPDHMEEGHRHPGPKHDGPDHHDAPPPPPFDLDEEFERPGPPEEDRRPENEGPEIQEHDGPEHMGRPHPEHRPEHEEEHRPEFDGPEHKPEFDGPEHRPEHGGPGPEHGPDHMPLPPPDHMGPPRHHKPKLPFFLHVFKWTVVGFLAAILLAALHKRTCSPSKRAARQARREKRELRRAYRRAVHKNAIMKLMARITGDGDDSDDEEKDMYEHQQLIGDAENGNSTMTEEITQLQNAASVVSDIVAASPQPTVAGPTISQPDITHSAPSERAHLFSDDLYSEELPAYEDNDGSEMSSVVADGFRYTPGSSDYSPSHSSSGSVSDILGPDTKQ